ncbi:MAG TPA: transglutaminase family protein [Methylibium sp.]|nr:transglutaminase family protein [Methylibium sp.]
MNDDLTPALRPTALIDADHADVVAFAARVSGELDDPVEIARALYLAVRDGFRYDPYRIDLSTGGVRASRVLADGHGWCVTKSSLLAAACRARGVPARVGYADVRNHLSTERLRAMIGTDDYVWHGYTSIFLAGRWRKATPAFNRGLCDKLGLAPLEFDGRSDSLYQEYDGQGRRHLEYVRQRGDYDDVPIDAIRAAFLVHYPMLVTLAQADFDQDVSRETRA